MCKIKNKQPKFREAKAAICLKLSRKFFKKDIFLKIWSYYERIENDWKCHEIIDIIPFSYMWRDWKHRCWGRAWGGSRGRGWLLRRTLMTIWPDEGQRKRSKAARFRSFGGPNDISFDFWGDRTILNGFSLERLWPIFERVYPFQKHSTKSSFISFFSRFCLRFLGPGLANFQTLWGHLELGHPKKGSFDTAQKFAVARIEPHPSGWWCFLQFCYGLLN